MRIQAKFPITSTRKPPESLGESTEFPKHRNREFFGPNRERIYRSGNLFADGDDEADLVGDEAERRRTHHTGQGGNVVKLLHHAVDAQPVHHVATAQIDHMQGTARLGIGLLQPVVEGEVGEGAVLALLGKTDDGEIAGDGKPARGAGTERHRLERALVRIDEPVLAGSRVSDVSAFGTY